MSAGAGVLTDGAGVKIGATGTVVSCGASSGSGATKIGVGVVSFARSGSEGSPGREGIIMGRGVGVGVIITASVAVVSPV